MSNEPADSDDQWKLPLDGKVSAWRLKIRTLAADIAKMQSEYEQLEEKVKAAEVLLGRPHMPEMHDADRPLSVREAIFALMKDTKVRDVGEMRAALTAAGYDPAKIGTQSGAFYTAIGRLVEKGQLVKLPSGSYRVKQPDIEMQSMPE